MNQEELDDLSSDDSDYCPDEKLKWESDVSGPDSDDPENEEQGTKKGRQKYSIKHKTPFNKPKIENFQLLESKPDPEEDKRKADALWAEFLGDSESSPKTTVMKATSISLSTSSKALSIPPTISPTVTKTFEFAGEAVEITSKAIEQDSSTKSEPKVTKGGFKRQGGGLSSVLSQIGKKGKLSVLEKTKLDWDGFKSNEGISEELQSFNRGRDGYLFQIHSSRK